MAKGQPDFGALAPTETIVGLSDLGELAARLGSIVTFDRRGNVIVFDDFENTLSNWWYANGGSGGSISISSERAKSGAFSCKLITGNAIGNYIFGMEKFAFPVTGKLGVEISWNLYTNLAIIEIDMYLYDGSTKWSSAVRYNANTDCWEYVSSAGVWTPLSPPVVYPEGMDIFNYFKLVADFANGEYVRLIANDLTYDLAGLPLYSVASATNAHLAVLIGATTRANASCLVYLDDLIITQNEP